MTWMRNLNGGQVFWEVNETVGFVFVPKNGLSLAEIPEEYVEQAKAHKCGCSDCGGRKSCLVVASDVEIEIWKSNSVE